MATGFVDRVRKHGEIRKQVLVVVTAGWSIMCFDHNLKKLWEADVQEDFPHGAHHREIAISISNYTLKHGDAGLVIVGGSMEVQPHDVQHHSSDSSELIPQHNYKLDAHALNSRHPGEMECREFRESILGVMPHRWERREDTRFELAHFRKHKRKHLKKMPGKRTLSPFHKPEESHVFGKDSTNKIASVIGKAAEYAASAKSKKRSPYIPMITNYTQLWWIPNVIVAHQKEGIEAIHLASGRTICKLKEYIDDTEDFINIQLDNVRNQLIQFELLLTTATFVVAIFGVVAGVFGMNIPIDLFEEPKAFKWVLIITGVVGGLIFFSFLWYFKHRRLMPL